MLPAQHRLTKREDFALIYKNGSYVGYAGIGLKFLKTNNPFARIGFPVGKNYSKKATQRNAARRILREAVRNELASLKPGYGLVFMIKSEKKPLDLSETIAIIKKIFSKANLLI
jgi:ribonuclease P protein component